VTVDAAEDAPLPGAGALGLIPAETFAALVGRSLRTLRNWDRAGLTCPVVIKRRRYYRADDVAAVLSGCNGRPGPRAGSLIKYLSANIDDGI
jgi:hypothetical protein